MLKVDIAYGRHSDTRSWKNTPTEWDDLARKCAKPYETPEKLKAYMALKRPKQDELKAIAGAFVGGYLVNGSRKTEHVLHRQVLCLDADNAKKSLWRVFKMMYGCAAFMYTTRKHTPEKPRMRIVILLDREVDVSEYEPISRRIASNIGINQIDHTTYDFNRYMYFPTKSIDGEFLFDQQKGKPLCADEVLATYRDHNDASSWPIGDSEKEIIRLGIKKQGEPTEKPGAIGAWCEVYGIREVINDHLSEVYIESDSDENRYSYAEGSVGNGLVLYENKWAYSHHATDPAGGLSSNAFDLCRIHMFGHLDGENVENTPINRRPSHLAMEEFAAEDKEVAAVLVRRRLEAKGADFEKMSNYADEAEEGEGEEPLSGDAAERAARIGKIDPKWFEKLDGDKKGNLFANVENIKRILENDPNIRNKFGLNEFSGSIEVKSSLPWGLPGPRPWTDDDWNELRCYLGREPYDIKRTPILEDVMSGIKRKFSFHPIKEYFESTVWDRKKRVDTLFIDYLGAEDNIYTREVTRRTLLAAVWRTYQPGCKYDELTTLVGPEGKGKSTIWQKLAGEWFSDTFNFGMLSGGNGIRAIEQIQGFLIVEVGEMTGLKKADSNAAKNFLSSRVDTYRPSHGKEVVKKPRHGILVGSSNNSEYLTAADGNRRHDPIPTHITEPTLSVWDDLTADEVAQIWAEVFHYYKKGQGLTLSAEASKIAREYQRDHEETDEWFNQVQIWLDEPVMGDNFDEKGMKRTKVCAADIWCGLGGHVKDINSNNTKRIHDVMRKMPGWKPTKSKVRFANHDQKQRGYYRISAIDRFQLGLN